MSAPRHLLFGFLALQSGNLTRQELVLGIEAWVKAKDKPLGEILVANEMIDEAERELLDRIVESHVRLHAEDLFRSVRTSSTVLDAVSQLRQIDDEEINTCVSKLVAAQARADESSSFPPTREYTAVMAKAASSSRRDETRFNVVRTHAKGGLGEVFVATDKELNRQVALKEIQPRFANDAESRERFMLEAEITSRLEHPGIVPVYGAGRYDDGRPFYAMRFIEGDSLADAIKAFHENETWSDSERTLELRKLLGQFTDVCEALGYAHSRGVIHRDIKPANIMLGKFGETLVVDWGLAKVAKSENVERSGDPSLGTTMEPGLAVVNPSIHGSAKGTPAYMSPEQARGEVENIGPASDVYSLGATLYQLLTGQPPVAGMDKAGEIHEGQIPQPSSLNASVPKPLEAICLMAMSLQPSERYSSPQNLASDVERFLADEGVIALADPISAKALRWTRKHPTLTTTTSAIVLISALSLMVLTTILGGKNAELANLNGDLDQKNARLTRTIHSETLAKQLAYKNENAAREQSQLALSILTSVIDELQGGLEHLAGSGEIRRRLLKTSLAELEKIAEGYVGQANVDHHTFTALNAMGEVVIEFGREDSRGLGLDNSGNEISNERQSAIKLANSFFRRANEIAKFLATDNPLSFQAQRDLANSYIRIGDLKLELAVPNEALLSYRESLGISRKLVDRDPENVMARHVLCVSINKIGHVQFELGQSEAALESHQEGLEIIKYCLMREPDNLVLRRTLSASFDNIGDNFRRTHQWRLALPYYQNLLENCEKLATEDLTNTQAQRDRSIAYWKLGTVQLHLGLSDDAVECHQKSLEIAERLVAEDGGNIQNLRHLAVSLSKVGDLQVNHLGLLDEALESFQRLVGLCEKLVAIDPVNAMAQRDLSISYEKIGDVKLLLNETNNALVAYQNGLDIAKKLTDDDANVQANRVQAVLHNKIGDVHVKLNQLNKAFVAYHAGHEITEKLVAVDPSNAQLKRDMSASLQKIGDAQLRLGHKLDALASYEKSLNITKKLSEADPANIRTLGDLGIMYAKIGDAQLGLGQSQKALDYYQRDLKISSKIASDNPSDAKAQRSHFISCYKIANAHRFAKSWDEAANGFRQASSVLARMIQRDQFVEFAKRAQADMDTRALAAERSGIALGNWDILLEQPTESLPVLLELRAIDFLRNSRHSDASQAADKLRELDGVEGQQLYIAASVFSLCAESISVVGDKKINNEQSRQRQTWINDAMVTLKRAIDAGWDDFAHMEQNPDFAVLRELPEFQALVPKD